MCGARSSRQTGDTATRFPTSWTKLLSCQQDVSFLFDECGMNDLLFLFLYLECEAVCVGKIPKPNKNVTLKLEFFAWDLEIVRVRINTRIIQIICLACFLVIELLKVYNLSFPSDPLYKWHKWHKLQQISVSIKMQSYLTK